MAVPPVPALPCWAREALPMLHFQALVWTHQRICPVMLSGDRNGQENLSPSSHGETGHTQLQEVKVASPLLLLWQPPLISDQSPLNLMLGKSPPDWGRNHNHLCLFLG